MLRVSLEDATIRLRELIEAVLKGETVFIVKDYQQSVQIVPAPKVPRRHFGSAKGLVFMADDFDAPLSDFAAYMP